MGKELETIDSILEELADLLGVYGVCYDDDVDGLCDESRNIFHCRVCFTMEYRNRIDRAVKIEEALNKSGL